MSDITLNKKQKRFCEYYIQSLNATDAYKRAYTTCKDGTARTNGSQLLAKPHIKAYIQDLMQQKQSADIADTEEILTLLTKVMRGEVTEEVPVVKRKGKDNDVLEMAKKQANTKDRIKAAELLGKRYNLFADKVDLEGEVNITFTGEEDMLD